MESPKTIKAQQEIDQTLAKIRRIDEAKARTIQEQASTKALLESLKAELPGRLAVKAIEQVTGDEVSALKMSIRDLESILPDFPLTLRGLDALEKQLRNSLREPRRLLSKVYEYQRVRDDLAAGGLSGVGMLRAMAGLLDFEEDTESFLSGLSHLRT